MERKCAAWGGAWGSPSPRSSSPIPPIPSLPVAHFDQVVFFQAEGATFAPVRAPPGACGTPSRPGRAAGPAGSSSASWRRPGCAERAGSQNRLGRCLSCRGWCFHRRRLRLRSYSLSSRESETTTLWPRLPLLRHGVTVRSHRAGCDSGAGHSNPCILRRQPRWRDTPGG
jgi:hypothetical protein